MSIVLDSESPKLFSILASIPGKKSLILDQTLSILVSSLATFTQLQDHGVESVKWLLQTQLVESSPSRVLIISRPDVESVEKAAGIVKATKGKEFTLLLIPRRTLQAEEVLEKAGIFSDIDIKVLPITYTQEDSDFVRVDTPPNPYSYPIVSPFEIFYTAGALISLQKQFGKVSRIRGKGRNVAVLAKILDGLEAELLIEHKTELEDDLLLGECIVLDRATDLITPLLTQLTYEGLLYESYHVSGSVLELPSAIQSVERKITLGPSDSIFADLRGENFSNVGPKLSGTASTLSTELDSRHSLKTTTQLKQFVSRIPNLQSSQKLLKVHIELTELLLAKTKSHDFRQILELEQSLYSGFPESDFIDPIESLIANAVPITTVLRLLCLWSGIHNGLKQKDYDSFCTRITQMYGHTQILTLHRLRHEGLFIVRTPQTERGRGGWTGFCRNWQLCPSDKDISESDPQDVAYLYSGYAPLNLRILEGFLTPQRFGRVSENSALKVLSAGVSSAVPNSGSGGGGGGSGASPASNIESMMKNLRGDTVDVSHTRGKPQDGGAVTVIVFLGGCTATELAGVRFLMKRLDRQCLILTKGLIHGSGLMQSLLHE